MNPDHPAWAAHLMRNLDEPQRNALIAQADNVIDGRAYWERMRLAGVEISMPFPWFALDTGEGEE